MEKTTRTPISKKTRFEVFKRDNFTCQYCSAKPPKVPLEIDHLKPVCKGGKNNIDNLITACFDCNRGKAGNELSSIPQTIIEKSEGKKLALLQYRDYQKLLLLQKAQSQKDINSVTLIYESVFQGYELTQRFELSIKQFIDKLGVEVVSNAMEYACNRIYDENKVIKYFCGICWNKIKEL